MWAFVGLGGWASLYQYTSRKRGPNGGLGEYLFSTHSGKNKDLKRAFDFSRNARVGDIAQSVWDNERVQLKPQQVAALLRDLGFETKNSHGVTVVVPSPTALVKACSECGYEDDSISALRKDLLSGREGFS